MIYKFRYSKILYFLPILFITFIFILGNYIYNLFPQDFIAITFIAIIVISIFYFTRKFMKYPIMYDSNTKTFYVITSIFSEKYDDFPQEVVKEVIQTSKNIVIITNDKTIVLSKHIENKDRLISLLEGKNNNER
ncbi:hypothetical protein [Petrotoga sp. 9PWA.NaAc.5.4]|uniref:hypothetical protein n=1 Tax=Petrotoga sp. 9PWA.NaAc.5.4 TaxID=1434328 RepID=UPI000CC89571|nr:hypothetical protein [Petrotoga sp. 9PWA.NaAc.5.4]PNR96298.1 hypothetical protein X924_02885 [Petrotoga sp. 9PWA.NaAc.5.4]